MAILESAAFWIVLAAVSELIALSPLKDNSHSIGPVYTKGT